MMRSVELFVGAGGLGIGVSQAGFRPAAVMDWDRWACDTLRENRDRGLDPIVHWPIHEGDVRKFDFASVGGFVDLVTGGPPCSFQIREKTGTKLLLRVTLMWSHAQYTNTEFGSE